MTSYSVILLLTLSYSVSLFIFQRGILTRRYVSSIKSSCDTNAHYEFHYRCLVSNSRPKFRRLIFLVIDALRYDFIEPNYDVLSGKHLMSNVAYLLKSFPNNAKLFPLIADGPTTTYQRIKAIVTGALPAFIEAGENFGGEKLVEDNFVEQFIARNDNVVLLGDETWLKIFPNIFHRQFTAPSFDIMDIDGVDNIVLEHIFTELDRKDWSMLLAHCLGVDHCGHRYNAEHPEMKRKLKQMDNLIFELVKKLPNDTLLMVTGDHGMTMSGDHGGDSRDETLTALFVYSKTIFPLSIPTKKELRQVDIGSFFIVKLYSGQHIVPTISILFGLSIPHSNTGMAIKEFFADDEYSYALKLNAHQILRYASEYTRFESSAQYKEQLRRITLSHESSSESFESNIETIENVAQLIRSVLITFNFELVFFGIFSMAEVVLFNVVVICNPSKSITLAQWVFRTALLMLQASVIYTSFPLSRDLVIFITLSLFLAIINHALSIFFHTIPLMLTSFYTSNFYALLSLFFLIVLSFSNSYVIYETLVLRFIIQLLIILISVELFLDDFKLFLLTSHQRRGKGYANSIFTQIYKNKEKFQHLLLTFFCMTTIRASKMFESCREEHVDCTSNTLNNIHETHQENFRMAFAVASLFVLNFIHQKMENSTFKNSVKQLLSRGLSWLIALSITIHWFFERSANINNNKKLESISRFFAQAVYIMWLFISISAWTIGASKIIFQNFSLVLMMIIGLEFAPIFTLNCITFMLLKKLIKKEFHLCFAFFLLGSLSFYGFGHNTTLNSIPWKAAFVGIPGNFPFILLPGTLILINVYAGTLLGIINLPTDCYHQKNNAMIYIMLFSGLKATGSMLACSLHRKHLMFYKVFATKFIFEAIGLLVCCIFSFLNSIININS